MIETEQTVTVNADIDSTWAYARDFERWASIMPGYQKSEIADEDNSTWILKIGVGAMVRTVTVNVHVEQWAGPERVDFTFQLKGDPVTGSGSYLAVPNGPDKTDMTLKVQVSGTGPMAPMWEAMGGPVLPKFAKSFAEELKGRIEAHTGGGEAAAGAAPEGPVEPAPGLLARLFAWLRGLFGAKA